jgi:hypothetical protein
MQVAASQPSRSIWRTNGTHLPHCGRQPQAWYTMDTEEVPLTVWGARSRSVSALHKHTYIGVDTLSALRNGT